MWQLSDGQKPLFVMLEFPRIALIPFPAGITAVIVQD